MGNSIIKLDENQLKKIISESVKRVLESTQTEGIDVSLDRKVTMTDKHERLVDTSLSSNPTFSDVIVDNIRVWSIFKRKEGLPDESDGNPLLYALKKEKHYTLTNPKIVNQRINAIADKFFHENSGADVTIMVPSNNQLNNYFANIIGKRCKAPKYIPDVLLKLSIEEVDDFVFEDNSQFRQYYGEKFPQAYKIFKNYCRHMKNGFQFHKVQDINMRHVIEHTIKLNDKMYGEYIDSINDRNVLIVDDSITLGQTLREACGIISHFFAPKSISVVTLFSPLYDETGSALVK